MRRFLPTLIYGIKDYLMIAFLLSMPWLLGFAQGGAETWVPVVLGVVALLHTVVTDFELGIFKLLPMMGHIMMDYGAGVFLIVCPWLFGFADIVWIPFVAAGVFELFVASIVHTVPPYGNTIVNKVEDHTHRVNDQPVPR